MDSEDSKRRGEQAQAADPVQETAVQKPEEEMEVGGQGPARVSGEETTTGKQYVEAQRVPDEGLAGPALPGQELAAGGFGTVPPPEPEPPRVEPSGAAAAGEAGAPAMGTGEGAAGQRAEEAAEPELMRRASEAAVRIGEELGEAAVQVEKVVKPMVEQATSKASSLLHAVVERGKRVFGQVTAGPEGPDGRTRVVVRAGEAVLPEGIRAPHPEPICGEPPIRKPEPLSGPPPVAEQGGAHGWLVLDRAAAVAQKMAGEVSSAARKAERLVSPAVEQAAARAGSLLRSVVGQVVAPQAGEMPDKQQAGAGMAPPHGVSAPAPEPISGEPPMLEAEPISGPPRGAGKLPAAAMPMLDRAAQMAQRVAGEAERLVTPVVEQAATKLRSMVEQGRRVLGREPETPVGVAANMDGEKRG